MAKENNINNYIFPATDCVSVFCEYMEVKSEQLGLSNNTLFNDPCGINNYSTARDMARCLIRGNESKILKEIWSCPQKGRPQKSTCRRTEHRSQLHGCCKGNRSCYS